MNAPARRTAQRQRPDNAATHAHAVRAAEQADQEQGKKAGIRHESDKCDKAGSLTRRLRERQRAAPAQMTLE